MAKRNHTNKSVSANQGIFYIHYDSINRYRNKNNPDDIRGINEIPDLLKSAYRLDLDASQKTYDTWLDEFCERMQKRYPSFYRCDHYFKRGQRLVLANSLFYVTIEDNNWSFAVCLLARKDFKQKGLQKYHFPYFLQGMSDCLFAITDKIYCRTGSWMAEPFGQNDKEKLSEHIKASRITVHPDVKATGGYNDQRKVQTTESE